MTKELLKHNSTRIILGQGRFIAGDRIRMGMAFPLRPGESVRGMGAVGQVLDLRV